MAESYDLRKTNDRPKRSPRTPLICYLPRGVRRVRKVRNRRRQVDLVTMLVRTGAVQR